MGRSVCQCPSSGGRYARIVPAHLDDAICIRQWDWSETSQVVSLLCREMGMIRGVAKGSRRPKSPYSGGIEPLTRGQVGVILRRNSELALITEWDLTEPWRHVRQDWRVYLAATYLADLVQHFVRDHDPHPVLFDRVVELMSMLEGSTAVWRPLMLGVWSVLSEAGYRPSLGVDVRTGEVLASARTYQFDPELGGLSVPALRHSPNDRARGGDQQKPSERGRPLGSPNLEGTSAGSGLNRAWGVRAATVEAIRWAESACDRAANEGGLVLAVGPDALLTDPAIESCERACRLLATYARYVLGSEPPSHEPLFGQAQRSESAESDR